jgi:glycosyltransferase involved in cell wall biosynthesis
MTPPFSVVIPTYRRAATLLRMLPSYLATGAREVVVVDDGSGPPHDAILARLRGTARVRLVTLPHVGLPAARNEGVAACGGTEWVVFGEDDCWYPRGYPSTLIEHALAGDAWAASGSARLVHPEVLGLGPDELERTIEAGATVGVHPPDHLLGATIPVERLPNGDLLTPMLTAGAAIHRRAFERARFDPGFAGNAFREETDFFLSLHEAGVRTVRCPHAVCGHVKADARAAGGGAWDMGRARYGMWMAVNNWRLLRKHEELLRRWRSLSGRPAGRARMQSEFLLDILRRARGPAAQGAPGPS